MVQGCMRTAKQLLYSWWESIQLFRPSELKLMLLVMLNMTWMGLKVVIKELWLLLLGIILVYGYFFVIRTTGSGVIKGDLESTALFWFVLGVLLWIRAIRPSIGIKNAHYIWNESMVKFVVLLVFFMFLEHIARDFNPAHVAPWYTYLIVWEPWATILSPLALLMIFWIFDARPRVREFGLSIWRACKMFVYHYPFFFIIYWTVRIIALASMIALSYVFAWSYLLVLPPVILLYCALVQYGYVRFLRQHSGRYYEKT